MALDYEYTLPDGVRIGRIDDADFTALLPALAELERQTGLSIDRYGDTRLYPDHARILAAALGDDPEARVRLVCDDLRTAAAHGAIIHCYGD